VSQIVLVNKLIYFDHMKCLKKSKIVYVSSSENPGPVFVRVCDMHMLHKSSE